MDYTVERLTARGENIRAEASFPVIDGAGRGVARINAFYRDLAERFLARATTFALPEGRYTATLSAIAAMAEDGVIVSLNWQLNRRGRVLEGEKRRQHWQLPDGLLLPAQREKKDMI